MRKWVVVVWLTYSKGYEYQETMNIYGYNTQEGAIKEAKSRLYEYDWTDAWHKIVDNGRYIASEIKED